MYNFQEFGFNIKYVIQFEQAQFWNYGLKFCITATSVSQRHTAKIQVFITFYD